MPITINGSGTVTGISAGGLPDATVTPAELTQPLTLGAAQASTSGTSIDFTGIPSWVKRVTVMFNGVSTNGTSAVQIQLGTSTGVETTGYLGGIASSSGTTVKSNFSSGFITTDSGSGNSSYTRHGLLVATLMGSNTWAAMLNIGLSNQNDSWYGAGSKALSGTLDRIRITTVNGTDTFDAGSINILYE